MQDVRRKVGSGIGKSHEEGGTNRESPIREREKENQIEMQRDMEKSGRERQTEGVKH